MITDLRDILRTIESDWTALRVLVVGDVMLDRYVWGDVERISPEAPVPVVRVALQNERPGGAANVAMNLAGLGACATVFGFGGGDPEQESLECLLAEAAVEPCLVTVAGVPTTVKLRVLAGHQQIMRLDTEVTPSNCEAEHAALLKQVFDAMPHASVVVLSDYAKGVLSEEICTSLIAEARRLQVPVLVDPKSATFTRYRRATTLCPNRKELSVATNEPVSNIERLLAAGQALVSTLELEFMTVTLGEKGIAVLSRDSSELAPAVARQVYDVSGAGDTVVAVLSLALASGIEIAAAAQLANVAAGIVVSQPGTVAIQREELLGALRKEIALRMNDKVVGLGALLSRVAAWRASGERLVFTNGCFDILHVGHISLLERARRLGDRLIVGLNSDNSVRRVKGLSRPVIGQIERARLLAALSAVDAVVVFDESTPLKMIEAIRPDVLVKGGDYSEQAIVGAREVRAWGGRVELVPLVEGVSTTQLIARSTAARVVTPLSALAG